MVQLQQKVQYAANRGGGRPRKKNGGRWALLPPPPPSFPPKRPSKETPPSLPPEGGALPPLLFLRRKVTTSQASLLLPALCVCVWRALSPQLCVSLFCMLSHAFGGVGGGGGGGGGGVGRVRSALIRKRIRGHRNRGGWGRLNRLCKLPLFVFFCPRRGKCILLIESSSCTGARAKKTTPKQPIPPLLSFCCRSVDNGGRHLNRSERGRKGVAQEGRDRPNFDPVRAPTQGLPQKLNRSNSSANGPHWGLPRSLSLFMQPESNF